MKLTVTLALVALAGFTSGCGDAAANGDTPAPPQAKPAAQARSQATSVPDGPASSPALQFLPRLQEAGRWELQGDPEVVRADQLTDYLASAADSPRAYGAIDLTVGRYRMAAPERWATVRILRFPDFVKAFGAYSSMMPPSARPVALGNRATALQNSIALWSGPYVAQIITDRPAMAEPTQAAIQGSQASPSSSQSAPSATPESSPIEGGLASLAAAVAERMPRAEGLPAVFRFFPQRGLIPGSEGFSAFPVLGQPILAGAFTARYAGADPTLPITGVIVPTPDKQVAQRALAQYRAFFERNGRLLDPVPNLGEENFVGEDRHAGRSVAFRLDRFVVIFNGYDEVLPVRDLAIESASRILSEIRKQLEAVEEQASDQAGNRDPR